MTVLFLTEYFPKSKKGEITGGVEARYFFLQKYLPRFGIDPVIFYRSHKPSSFGSPLRLLAAWLNFYHYCWKESRRINFDLVEGANFLTYPLAWLIGLSKRKPVVYCYHDSYLGVWVKRIGVLGLIGEIAERLALILPGVHYIAVSKTIKNKLLKVKKDLKVKVIYNGVEITLKPMLNGKKGLVCVTRLVPYKGVDVVIAALSLLKKSNPGLTLTIIGQGPHLISLKRQAKELGINKSVKFLGFVPSHNRLLYFVRKAKVFCSASTVEGFGIALVEAMSVGTPYVAVNIPAVREVTLSGKGGVLVKNAQVQEFTKGLKVLLTESTYLKKQSETKKIAQLYSWSSVSSQLASYYLGLLKAK